MVNVRARGKIPHDEWPKIAERFRKGETLTEIARSYRCTAPAIRYIVARVGEGRSEKGKRVALAAADHIDGKSTIRPAKGLTAPAGTLTTSGIWSRMNSDIASFLDAVATVSARESDENYEALLMATDRLLWGSARTRLEIEELLRKRKESASARRMSG